MKVLLSSMLRPEIWLLLMSDNIRNGKNKRWRVNGRLLGQTLHNIHFFRCINHENLMSLYMSVPVKRNENKNITLNASPSVYANEI